MDENEEDVGGSALSAFVLSLFAGGATSLGGLVVCFLSPEPSATLMAWTLSLAAGVMLAVSILELVVPKRGELGAVIWFGGGCLSYWMLSSLARCCDRKVQKTRSKRARQLGILMCLALTLHNLPEGLAVAVTASASRRTGLVVAIAIALHNVPEGLAIAVPLHASAVGKCPTLLATVASGFSEPVGAALGLLLLRFFKLTPNVIEHIEAAVAGIMSSIAVFELIPEALNQQRKVHACLGFGTGWLLISLTIWLLDSPKPPLAFLDNALLGGPILSARQSPPQFKDPAFPHDSRLSID